MRYHGKKGSVSIGPTPTLVASLNSWSYEAATDKADVTAFGDVNKQYVTGLPDVKGSLAGWFDDEEEALFLAAEAGVPVQLQLMPVSTVTGLTFSGLAYLDCSIECPADGPVSVSGEWVAAGPWTRAWPTGAAAAAAARAAEGKAAAA